MADRTFRALGAGFSTWIELEAGGVILTPDANGVPHAFAKDADEASARFGCKKGAALDRGGDPPRVLYDQRFEPEVLRKLKIESERYYADRAPVADAAAG